MAYFSNSIHHKESHLFDPETTSNVLKRVVVTVPVTILQLNAEGLTRAKRDLIRHFTDKHDANVLLIPETHIYDVAELSIGGLSLTDHVPDKHGDDIDATLTKKSASESSVESTTKIGRASCRERV